MYMLVYVHLTFETVPQLEWTDMSNKLEASNGTSEPWEVILNSWGYLASLKCLFSDNFPPKNIHQSSVLTFRPKMSQI